MSDLRDVPHSVYVAWADELPLYVGCSSNYEARLRAHRNEGAEWVHAITRVTVVDFPNKYAALDFERETIFRLQPVCNLQGKRRLTAGAHS